MKRPLLLGLIVLSIVLGSSLSTAQIPRLLSYQGILTDTLGAPKPDGMWSVTFRLYDVQSGGSALWTEGKTLQTKSGLFSTVLGDQVVIPASMKFDKPYWLGVQIAAQPELSPRVPLTAVGYTLHSTVADTAKYALSAPLQAAVDSARVAFVSYNLEPGSYVGANNSTYGFNVQNFGTGDGIRGFSASTLTNYAGLYGVNTSTGTAVYGASQGGYGGYFTTTGPTGVYGTGTSSGLVGESYAGNGVNGTSTSGPGVNGTSTSGLGGNFLSTNNYAGYFVSTNYRGLYSRSASAWYAGYFVNAGGSSFAGLYVDGTIVASGSKTGYVVDLAQNDGPDALEPGDVVAITGYAPPVYGERIPVVRVSKARTAETSAVAGVVDDHYVVTPGLLAQGAKAVAAMGVENLPHVAPRNSSQPNSTIIGAGEYLTFVTLGSFLTVKVDATYGAVQPGDLLVSSPNPGYAMKAVSPKTGTVIGKALGALAGGTGTVPVLVTLH